MTPASARIHGAPLARAARFAAGFAFAALAGCASVSPAPDYAAVLVAPDRLEADRAIDGRRKAQEMLTFIDARPGMRVLDVAAGAGYTTELMARSVAPNGVVYSQESPEVQERLVKDRYDQRAARPALKNATRLIRPYDDPLPAGVGDLDRITILFSYHDTAYMNVDRPKMNARLFAALKPGGQLIVADHSAKPGDGISVVRTLHRIEESVVRRELEAAGFRLVGSADFLRNPNDPRTAIVFRPQQPNDEFVLKFERPR